MTRCAHKAKSISLASAVIIAVLSAFSFSSSSAEEVLRGIQIDTHIPYGFLEQPFLGEPAESAPQGEETREAGAPEEAFEGIWTGPRITEAGDEVEASLTVSLSEGGWQVETDLFQKEGLAFRWRFIGNRVLGEAVACLTPDAAGSGGRNWRICRVAMELTDGSLLGWFQDVVVMLPSSFTGLDVARISVESRHQITLDRMP